MAIRALGINHKTAPVSVREQVAFDPAKMPVALSEVCGQPGIAEAVILSTCNRTELYVSTSDEQWQQLRDWLAHYHRLDVNELDTSLYVFDSEEAIKHTMRVASGLDSLVLGEPQILGQMKSAYAVAQEAGTIGAELGRLFRQTFSVAKRVRTDTAIGENPVSVAFAAVRMAQHIFSNLSDSRALLIGAGETIELVARHLRQVGIGHLVVANRTLTRAQHLAEEFHAEAVLLEDIPEVLPDADIVISSTASPLPILGKGAVEKALRKRRHKPMFMVDIAVPRDIEEEVAELGDVYLYTVDDLRTIIEENVKSREDAAQQAEELILSGVEHFMRELRVLDAVTVVTELRAQVDLLREEQLEKALKQMANGGDPEQALRQFAHTFSNKMLHSPTVALRQAAADGRAEVFDWTREMFGLSINGQEDNDLDTQDS